MHDPGTTPSAPTVDALIVDPTDPGFRAAHPPDDPEPRLTPAVVDRLTGAAMFFFVLFFPLWFGGVHLGLLLPAQTALLLIAAAAAWFNPEIAARSLQGSAARWVSWMLGLFAGACLLRYGFALFGYAPHPVLGSFQGLASKAAFWDSFRGIAAAIAVFGLTRMYLESRRAGETTLVRLLCAAGFLVGLIALSHWFYDNGKLFWIFAPDNVFVSERARWPFVNANNLGHFLLPLLFLLIAAIAREVRHIKRSSIGRAKSIKQAAQLISSGSGMPKLITVGFLGVAVFSTALAILASQSRGSWLGLSVGLIVLLVTQPRRAPIPAAASPQFQSSTRRRSSSRHSASSGASEDRFRDHRFGFLLPISAKFGTLILWLCVAAMLYFFLIGKGAELVENRIEYGLLHSKEDIRWQMYDDTLRMVRDYPLSGVGLGNWAAWYPRYMHPQLSGINPEYLHNDPLQLVAETGLVGTLLLCLLVGGLAFLGVKAIRSEPRRSGTAVMQQGLLCGLLALVVASLVDFPFHIPAISIEVGILLALTVFYIDPALKSK